MNIFKTSFLSLVSTAFKIVVMFVINKIVAVIGGPSAMATLGNFQNFYALSQTVNGGFLQTGVTKFTASSDDKLYFFSSSLSISFILNLIFVSLLFCFSDDVARLVFNTENKSFLVKVWAISLPFTIFCSLYLGYLNGIHNITRYIALNIANSTFLLLFVVLLYLKFDVTGVFFAYFLTGFSVFLIICFNLRNSHERKKYLFKSSFYKEGIPKLIKFSIITLSAIVISNLTLVALRQIISNYSVELAGNWQGLWSFSQVLLSFITLSLSTYLLPSLATKDNIKEIWRDLKNALLIVVPFMALMGFVSFVLRDFVVSILFSPEFTEMSDLFFWQMIGNTIKAASWVFGYLLVAKGLVKVTVSSELFCSLFFIVSCYVLLDSGNAEAPVVAYFLTSIIHLFFVIFYFIKRFNNA